jgi:hypothetical protein
MSEKLPGTWIERSVEWVGRGWQANFASETVGCRRNPFRSLALRPSAPWLTLEWVEDEAFTRLP